MGTRLTEKMAQRARLKGLINIPLLDKVIARIEKAKPERCIMRTFQDTEAPCGTAYCIAGWIVAIGKIDAEWNTCNAAAQAIGITRGQGNDLFGLEGGKLGHDAMYRFDREVGPEKRKAAMLDVLKHLRRTGEVDWPKALKKNKIKL